MTQRRILDLDSVGAGPVCRELRGLGDARVEVFTLGDSVEFADRYFGRPIRVDYQRFVSALIARMVTLPELSLRMPRGFREASARASGLRSPRRQGFCLPTNG